MRAYVQRCVESTYFLGWIGEYILEITVGWIFTFTFVLVTLFNMMSLGILFLVILSIGAVLRGPKFQTFFLRILMV
ncbi:hypothetical protein WA026_009557 [Henosepilachna vigintioctopunctata]|uniref:Uncharacterized protein n=1 Tax=Henosepilachna vigintioctopunctata TaxID=420089 RepID=A0AAW1U484_9CUCU